MPKKNNTKKKPKKPSAKMLGQGMARQAAEAIKKRQKELDKLMKSF